MSDADRYAHYDRDYYINRACPESASYAKRILRPGDMGAALCYAFGIDSYADVCRVLGIPEGDPRFLPETTLDEQIVAVLRTEPGRAPHRVLEVGGGRGGLACAFALCGIHSVIIEPSPAAFAISFETAQDWLSEADHGEGESVPIPYPSYWQMRLGDAAPFLCSMDADTIIFCESIEHIPEPEFAAAWPLMVEMLRRTAGRLIITNWIDYHPIVPDDTGWDHVRLVDDAFYDALARDAAFQGNGRTVFRQGSHLVLEF